MTKVTFFKRDGIYYGFSESGHSGYGDEGNDILCSAISAMTMLIVNAIEVSFASNVEYSIDEETTDITVIARGALSDFEDDERKCFAISGLLKAYFLQLTDLTEEYYDYLEVKEIDDYDDNSK